MWWGGVPGPSDDQTDAPGSGHHIDLGLMQYLYGFISLFQPRGPDPRTTSRRLRPRPVGGPAACPYAQPLLRAVGRDRHNMLTARIRSTLSSTPALMMSAERTRAAAERHAEESECCSSPRDPRRPHPLGVVSARQSPSEPVPAIVTMSWLLTCVVAPRVIPCVCDRCTDNFPAARARLCVAPSLLWAASGY